jgi:opacity protein-like surface antigen
MRALLFLLTATLATAGPAAAQATSAPAQPHADVHAVVGWQNLRSAKSEGTFERYDDWANGILYGGAGAGWYWNENLKTQVDVGGGTEGRHHQYRLVTIGGLSSSEASTTAIQKTSVAISQQYQFFRNQWFHPHVGAGLDVARETRTTDYTPVYVYDPVTRISRQVTTFRTEGPVHRTEVRPFGQVGFKAYMTRRAFFTADTRLMFRSGIDEVLFRLGFGVDF